MSRLLRIACQHREGVLRWPLARRWTVFLLLWSSLTLGGNLFFVLCARMLGG